MELAAGALVIIWLFVILLSVGWIVLMFVILFFVIRAAVEGGVRRALKKEHLSEKVYYKSSENYGFPKSNESVNFLTLMQMEQNKNQETSEDELEE